MEVMFAAVMALNAYSASTVVSAIGFTGGSRISVTCGPAKCADCRGKRNDIDSGIPGKENTDRLGTGDLGRRRL